MGFYVSPKNGRAPRWGSTSRQKMAILRLELRGGVLRLAKKWPFYASRYEMGFYVSPKNGPRSEMGFYFSPKNGRAPRWGSTSRHKLRGFGSLQETAPSSDSRNNGLAMPTRTRRRPQVWSAVRFAVRSGVVRSASTSNWVWFGAPTCALMLRAPFPSHARHTQHRVVVVQSRRRSQHSRHSEPN